MTPPSVEALNRSPWREEAFDSLAEISGRLNNLAIAAEDAEDADCASSLRVLGAVASLHLQSESPLEPYGPMFRFGDRRSLVPTDLSEDDLAFFADVLPEVPAPAFAARIADVLWIRRHGDAPYEYARASVAEFLRVPIEASGWTREIHDQWVRTINLARQLRMDDLLASMEYRLEDAFFRESGHMALDLAELRARSGDVNQDARNSIAERLRALAPTADSEQLQRDLHRASAQWFVRAADANRSAEESFEIVRSWIEEAAQRSADSAAVANSFYESALQEYRQIPSSQRERLDIGDVGENLVARIRTSGAAALSEMATIESDPVDLTDAVAQVRALVSGKKAVEALRAFVGFAPYMNEADERVAAEAVLQDSPLIGLFGTTHYALDGRVIHKTVSGAKGPWGYDSGTWNQMMQAFEIKIRLLVSGGILPGLEQLVNEHPLTLADFINIASRAAVVPRDRVITVARALFAGYSFDFTSALYLAVPQVENIVREALQAAGISTSTVSIEGVGQERGISSLLDEPEAVKVFGPDVSFELRALFAGPTGPNLRNEAAHGLLSDRHGNDVASIYCWWFLLRLVYSHFWNQGYGAADASDDAADGE